MLQPAVTSSISSRRDRQSIFTYFSSSLSTVVARQCDVCQARRWGKTPTFSARHTRRVCMYMCMHVWEGGAANDILITQGHVEPQGKGRKNGERRGD